MRITTITLTMQERTDMLETIAYYEKKLGAGIPMKRRLNRLITKITSTSIQDLKEE